MQYLFFLNKNSGLLRAIGAALLFWKKGISRKIEKPSKNENGDFIITRVDDSIDSESDGLIDYDQTKSNQIDLG